MKLGGTLMSAHVAMTTGTKDSASVASATKANSSRQLISAHATTAAKAVQMIRASHVCSENTG